MESGRPKLASRSCVLIFLSIGLSVVSGAYAQQPAAQSQADEAGQASAPAAVPAAQPITTQTEPNTPAEQAAAASDAAEKKSSPAIAAIAPAESVPVKLGVGDLLEVGVYNVPELTTKARVSNSGDVYLPLIDYVHVEGLSLEEAQTVIQKRLEDGGFVRSPHVTIFVDEASSQGVTVIGEVTHPGIFADPVDHKLYQVISEAGGFTVSASRKLAIIRRGLPDPIRIELPRNLSDDLSGNVDVLPGDTITVPRAPIIYVVGDVGRPSGFLVDNGRLTVLQALALAGGTNRTAKMQVQPEFSARHPQA